MWLMILTTQKYYRNCNNNLHKVLSARRGSTEQLCGSKTCIWSVTYIGLWDCVSPVIAPRCSWTQTNVQYVTLVY